MRPNALVFTTVLMIVLSRAAVADSYIPFEDYRIVDAAGQFYVVVKRLDPRGVTGTAVPVVFQIAERRPGSAPVDWASGPNPDQLALGAKPDPANVRKGDVVVGKGMLDRPPRRIVASTTGLGFVGADVYGHNFGELRDGHALVVVSKDGTIRHRKNLIDLFSGSELDGFFHSVGSDFLFERAWIDERRREIVVVSLQAVCSAAGSTASSRWILERYATLRLP